MHSEFWLADFCHYLLFFMLLPQNWRTNGSLVLWRSKDPSWQTSPPLPSSNILIWWIAQAKVNEYPQGFRGPDVVSFSQPVSVRTSFSSEDILTSLFSPLKRQLDKLLAICNRPTQWTEVGNILYIAPHIYVNICTYIYNSSLYIYILLVLYLSVYILIFFKYESIHLQLQFFITEFILAFLLFQLQMCSLTRRNLSSLFLMYLLISLIILLTCLMEPVSQPCWLLV